MKERAVGHIGSAHRLCLPAASRSIGRRLPWVLAMAGVVVLAAVRAGVASAGGCPNEAFRTGSSAALPDCRAFEQVSPVEKEDIPAVSRNYPVQSTGNGEALAYMNLVGAYSSPKSAPLPSGYVARRGASGWGTTNVSPPVHEPPPPGGIDITYVLSSDLSQLLVNVPDDRLAPGAPAGVYNLFQSNPDGTYTWVNDATPAHVPPEGCPPFILVLCFQIVDNMAPAGTSADFHHVLFESDGSIGGAPEFRENLYESADEGGAWHVRAVGVLPDGKLAEGSTAGSGSRIYYSSFTPRFGKRVLGAISQDGSLVVFQAAADEGAPDPAQHELTEVYDRMGGAETIELSAPAPGAKPASEKPAAAKYWAASADGGRVFFTSKAELTTQSFTGAAPPECEESEPGCDHGDLYEYDLETKALKDLTVDKNLPADEEQGAAILGVVDASSDGSYVYFVAKGQLVPGKGVDHADNLYMVHNGGSPVYISTLSESDGGDWTENGAVLEAYVTPDGRHLAFTSVESLRTVNFPSGYDNVSEGGGAQPEVYEYSAPTAAEEAEGLTGSVACASCNPSGAPPLGPGLLGGVPRYGAPGSDDKSALYQVRAVDDNGGRVFFSSPDPLVPEAKGNTQAKVYEYERDGEGSCTTSTGCVYLLSSPDSSEEATFLDADVEANNVFIATDSQLVGTDRDNLFDVYDARVGGGVPLPASEQACHTGCRPPVLEAPSGPSLLSGFAAASGNVSPSPAGVAEKTVKRTAARIRAEKLARALKACRRDRGRQRRRSCEAQARKRYGAHTKAKRSSNGKGRGR